MKRRFKLIAALMTFALILAPVSAEARMLDDDYPPMWVIHEPPEERLIYYGTCTVTHYCPCAACCGIWAGGNTASGTTPTAGRTVANGELPFGTRILLNGYEYIVEDRGVNGKWIDVFVDDHAEADALGMYQADIWIIE